MEDKFGYLMKQEFEDHFLDELRKAIKERPDCTPQQLHDRVVMTWGGRHSADTTKYKLR